MRPDFALTLSEDGIGLLYRAKGGWRSLGETSLDDPGLGETLRLMRETAQSLAQGPMLTKLVIPDSQILYTTLPLHGHGRAEKRAALRKALDGRTPYALDELVFDWTDDGESARLAVVARETLAEAEAFAVQHAFDPVCFVAAPQEAAAFGGEPFFGASELAAELLQGATHPRADDHPARPGAMAPAHSKATAPRANPTEPEPACAPEPPAVTFRSRRGETDTPPVQPLVPSRDEPSPTVQGPRRLDLAAASSEAAPRLAPVPHKASAKADPITKAASDTASPAAPERPLAPGTASAVSAPRQADERMGRAAPVSADQLSKAVKVIAPTLAKGAASAGLLASRAGGAMAGALEQVRSGVSRGVRRLGKARAGAKLSAKRSGSMPARPGTGALTPFGARRVSSALTMSPARRRGLMLGAGGVAFAAVAGLWMLLLWEESPGNSPEQIAALPERTAPALPREAADAEIPAVAPAAPDAAAPDMTAKDAPGTSAPRGIAAPTLTLEEAQGTYAATGLWQRAPEAPALPVEGRIDSLYLAGIDPAIRPPQKISLPDPDRQRANDAALAVQVDPPGPGQTFDLDDRGLVEATPDGAVTPLGITVTAGRPAMVPPARPEGLVPDLPDGVVMAPSNAAATRLAPFRPRLRPEGLTPAAVPAPGIAVDDDALDPATGPAPALSAPLGISPPRRPETIAPTGPGNAADAPPAESSGGQDATAPADDEATAGTGEGPLSALALARSPQPRSRPSGLPDKVAALAPAVPKAAAAAPPAIPTTASVAKQATLPNAINLRQINLIGVYGTDNARRALLRLPSGRYVKVQVGDRVDGGQVAAIGEDSLSYVKGGRSTMLELPGG
ncbi:hypothetical protein EV663_10725 [Rhodovulum bhavnagarense]|uniref:Type IV pilus biogenesis protein PilP n=1 Tax=Rhodovulum bhavnagarense TaxID=992286 RepID=A0A4R2RM77_9RHOB|nr:hypothetical protein [Rhodovulum bhavnagarense]TCP60851.1 hypothetical protein EV663_10725 [Rhodovulum bhavnagarense]